MSEGEWPIPTQGASIAGAVLRILEEPLYDTEMVNIKMSSELTYFRNPRRKSDRWLKWMCRRQRLNVLKELKRERLLEIVAADVLITHAKVFHDLASR